MIDGWRIEGHAIVSADGRIADADGNPSPELRNDADWARFQAALDAAAVVALGRLGHDAHPNLNRRNRLVLSSGADGIERRDDAWWWNPAAVPLADALAAAAPGGGIVAVPGGRRVFDLFPRRRLRRVPPRPQPRRDDTRRCAAVLRPWRGQDRL